MKGVEVIKEALKQMPDTSGVYRMIGADERLLYIGKAKNLKNRVSNYTVITQLSTRIARMVFQVERVEFTVTTTEAQALVLEAHLIKHNKPPYNILLRDDKTFPYIAIDNSHDFPRIYKYRGQKKKNVSYYGPYPTVWAVNQAIKALQKVFLVRPCDDSYFKNRTRPCIEYEIKRCSAPCVNKIDKANYAELITQSKNFLSGRSDEVKNDLQNKMNSASENMEYEMAAFYRNRISALSSIQTKQPINCKTFDEADIIAIFRKGNIAAIQVFFVRNSYILGNTEYFPKEIDDLTDTEILEFFITSFYEMKPVPKNIFVSSEVDNNVVEQALEEIANTKTEILFPQKGEKKALIDMALKNAELALDKKLAEEENTKSVLKKIEVLFGINKPISRIDVFDNSHLFGKSAVGAMIVAGFDEENKWGFQKKLYRKFNVDSGEKETGGDDFYMMKQALKRRYSVIASELERTKQSQEIETHNNSEIASLAQDELSLARNNELSNFPELILIDGGKPQLTAAYEVFKELGVLDKFVFVGIAKGIDRNAGNEEFFMIGRESFRLEPNSAELYFLQNLRDEAHRFAITSHRNKRNKSLTKSGLDEIDDIGPTRKKALLSYFGSVKDIEAATIEDLMKVDGINKTIAEKVFEYFH